MSPFLVTHGSCPSATGFENEHGVGLTVDCPPEPFELQEIMAIKTIKENNNLLKIIMIVAPISFSIYKLRLYNQSPLHASPVTGNGADKLILTRF